MTTGVAARHPLLVLGGGRAALQLRPGRRVVARVVAVEGRRVRLNLAGELLEATLEAGVAVSAGATVALRVEQAGDGRVRIRLESGP